MLAITEVAAEAIQVLTTDADLPEGGGLRIAAPDPDEGGLQLALVPAPRAEDIVVGGDGAAVFLEAAAAAFLDDKVLDVQTAPAPDGGQELRFAIGPQVSPQD